MNDIQITIIVGIFMLISYIWAKIPYGMTAVLCSLALEVTGVLSANEAWGGFGSTTVLLFASVFILGAGLMKTSFIAAMQRFIERFGNGEGGLRWFCSIIAAFLAMLTSATASGVTMLPVVSIFCRNGNLKKGRILKVVMDAACMGFAIMPFGMGAAFIEQGNAYLEAMGAEDRLSPFASMFVRLPVLAVTIIFMCLVVYRFLPNREGGEENIEENISVTGLAPVRDKIGIAIFFGSILAMIASSLAGIPSHYAPMAGALLMVISGVLSGKEAFRAIDLNTVCIFAGSLSFAEALTKSGIAEWIARQLAEVADRNVNQHLIIAVFLLVPFIMTQFMGNIPVINLSMPIAATVAVATGMNSASIMIATIAGATLSVATPMAAGIQALIMEPGDYRFIDYIKTGIPTALVFTIVYVIWAPVIYPMF